MNIDTIFATGAFADLPVAELHALDATIEAELKQATEQVRAAERARHVVLLSGDGEEIDTADAALADARRQVAIWSARHEEIGRVDRHCDRHPGKHWRHWER